MLFEGDTITVPGLGSCTVGEVESQYRMLVTFNDHGGFQRWCNGYSLLDGSVRIPKPTVHGFGVLDIVGVKGTWMEPLYERWRSMVNRCYGNHKAGVHVWYKGVEVCDDWRYFSNFLAWAESKDWFGKELDKDLLSRGSGKLYSPETCCFISPKLNSLIARLGRNPASLPVGVSFDKSRRKYLSTGLSGQKRFDTAEEAYYYWSLRFRSEIQGFYPEVESVGGTPHLESILGRLPTMMGGNSAVPFIKVN